jgi:hypothetical protein
LSPPKPVSEGSADKLIFGNRRQLHHHGCNGRLAHVAMTVYIKFRPDKPVPFGHDNLAASRHVRQQRSPDAVYPEGVGGKLHAIPRHGQHRPPAETGLNPNGAAGPMGIAAFVCAQRINDLIPALDVVRQKQDETISSVLILATMAGAQTSASVGARSAGLLAPSLHHSNLR